MTETVASLAALVGGAVHGDGSRSIRGVGDLRSAGPDRIGFLRDPKLLAAARTTTIGALLVGEPIDTPAVQVLVGNVDTAFARVAQRFHPLPRAAAHRVDPSAQVHPEAVLSPPVRVDACAVVGAGARIGAGTIVGAGAVVGDGVRVGADCVLFPRVVLYAGVSVGNRVVVHSGAVIGADGFGYAREADGEWVKWPQLGTVVIDDDVEIGANTTIDRGALGATRIGQGSKLDNLVHIGHNCTLGRHVAVAGCSALSGSVSLGDRVQLAGHTVSSGHIAIGDDVRIGGASVLYRDIDEPGDYIGYPPMVKAKWFRTLRALDRLTELAQEVANLRRQLARQAPPRG